MVAYTQYRIARPCRVSRQRTWAERGCLPASKSFKGRWIILREDGVSARTFRTCIWCWTKEDGDAEWRGVIVQAPSLLSGRHHWA